MVFLYQEGRPSGRSDVRCAQRVEFHDVFLFLGDLYNLFEHKTEINRVINNKR